MSDNFIATYEASALASISAEAAGEGVQVFLGYAPEDIFYARVGIAVLPNTATSFFPDQQINLLLTVGAQTFEYSTNAYTLSGYEHPFPVVIEPTFPVFNGFAESVNPETPIFAKGAPVLVYVDASKDNLAAGAAVFDLRIELDGYYSAHALDTVLDNTVTLAVTETAETGPMQTIMIPAPTVAPDGLLINAYWSNGQIETLQAVTFVVDLNDEYLFSASWGFTPETTDETLVVAAQYYCNGQEGKPIIPDGAIVAIRARLDQGSGIPEEWQNLSADVRFEAIWIYGTETPTPPSPAVDNSATFLGSLESVANSLLFQFGAPIKLLTRTETRNGSGQRTFGEWAEIPGLYSGTTQPRAIIEVANRSDLDTIQAANRPVGEKVYKVTFPADWTDQFAELNIKGIQTVTSPAIYEILPGQDNWDTTEGRAVGTFFVKRSTR